MSNYHISTIHPTDKRAQRQLDALLAQAGIQRDGQLDETIGIYDEAYTLVATGSLSANTLRCIAVDASLQGEGLSAMLVTALIERQAQRGNHHVFLYTKPDSARFFTELGFYEIARVDSRLVFMENRRDAFQRYLSDLSAWSEDGKRTAAIVMNANPFTLGHQYLLEKAASENDAVRCFVVSEDISLVPFADRFELVKAGSAHLGNVTVHPSGSYIISSATFPSYFMKEDALVTETQAQLDIEIFSRIAEAMGITRRYIGEEPFSKITQIYNGIMERSLPGKGIECVLIPRKQEEGAAISASGVRQLIHDGNIEAIKPLIPASTYAYFFTENGQKTIETIQQTEKVRHD